MQVERIENQLIIRETPGCIWIFSLLFLVVGGLFVYGSLGNFESGGAPLWLLPLTFVFGSIACAVGLWLLNRAPITRIVINRDNETLSYTTYGVAGRTHKLYHFDEIEKFCLIEELDDESSLIWSLGLEFIDGEVIKISALASHNQKYKLDFVFAANEFMYKQMPVAQDVFQLEDESEGEIS
jgi:hypothetical protein